MYIVVSSLTAGSPISAKSCSLINMRAFRSISLRCVTEKTTTPSETIATYTQCLQLTRMHLTHT